MTLTANQDASTFVILQIKSSKLTCNTEILFVILYRVNELNMYFIEKAAEFDKWLRNWMIWEQKQNFVRLQKLENEEYFGSYQSSWRWCISELKINYAKVTEFTSKLMVNHNLLIGGDKSTQQPRQKEKKFGKN